jgi:hypothetical protein
MNDAQGRKPRTPAADGVTPAVLAGLWRNAATFFVGRPDYAEGFEAGLRKAAGDLDDWARRNVPELQATGTVTTGKYTDHVSTAEDYARYAAQAMNAATADDTEFIADGAAVTAYVHCLAHMSATFELDAARLYPRTGRKS